MHPTDRCPPHLKRCAGVVVCLLLGAAACLAQAPGAPGRLVVSDIIIEGSRMTPAETVRARLKTRPGAEYSPAVLQDDVRELFKTRWFANVWWEPLPDGRGRVKIKFHLVDCPSTVEKITFLGPKHISDDDLNQVTNVHKGMALNPHLNRQACLNITKRLNEDGRPFAHCELLKGGDPRDTEVVFSITEGPKVAVREVQFTGNTFLTSARLRTQIQSSGRLLGVLPFGNTYSAQQAEQDMHKLAELYRKFGYQDVQIGRELQWTPDGRELILVFHIHEGIRYRVEGVPDVVGPKAVPPEQFTAMSAVKSGDYYSEDTVKADLDHIQRYYGYMGRVAKVQPVMVWSKDNVPGVVQVQYQVMEQQPARVGQILVDGNQRTRQNVIIRQIPLFPGQLLTYPDLEVANNNLKRLGIFGPETNVSVLEDPMNPGAEYKDIRVHIQENDTGSLMFGVGVNSNSGFTGSIVLNERNFDILRPPTSIDDFLNGTAWRGAGQEFRLELVPGTQLQRYTVTFREPFLFDTPWSFISSGYYWTRYYNEYTEQREGGKFTLGRRLNPFWSVSGGIRLENVGVHNVSQFAPIDYQGAVGNNALFGFRSEVIRDTRDSFLRATSGSLLDLSWEQVTGVHNFPLANAVLSKYWTAFQRPDGSGKQVVALHSQFGWAGSTTPVYERFFAGGFNTIRGFQFRGVGPDVNGFKVGGDFLLLNSLEYQIPVLANDNIWFVTFVDSGTVTPRITQWDTYRVSAGFGVRFTMPMLGPVPIALDFGFPIVKGNGDNTQIFNFWMGFFR